MIDFLSVPERKKNVVTTYSANLSSHPQGFHITTPPQPPLQPQSGSYTSTPPPPPQRPLQTLSLDQSLSFSQACYEPFHFSPLPLFSPLVLASPPSFPSPAPLPPPSRLFFTLLFAPSLSPLVIYGRVVASLPLISNLAASFVIWLQNKLHSSQVLEVSVRFISGVPVF